MSLLILIFILGGNKEINPPFIGLFNLPPGASGGE